MGCGRCEGGILAGDGATDGWGQMVNGRKEAAASMMVRQVLAREGARVSDALTAKKERSVEGADGV